MRNLYRKKRNFQETEMVLPSPIADFKEKKPVTILSQKDYDQSSFKVEVFDEATLNLISAFKKKQEHLNSNSSSKQFNPFLNSKESKAKVLNAPTNWASITNPQNDQMPAPFTFNFNFNFSQSNSAFDVEEDQEDTQGSFNPEEELEIEPSKDVIDTPTVSIVNQSEKYATSRLEALQLYDFSLRKYIDKGSGKISLELFKGNSNKGIVAFRAADGTVVLFQGSVIPGMTTLDQSKKDLFVAVMNKVFSQKEGKLENNALKMRYATAEDKEAFIKGFNRLVKAIKGDSSEKEKEKKNEQASNPVEVKKKVKGSEHQLASNKSISNEKVPSISVKTQNDEKVKAFNPFLEYLFQEKSQPEILLNPSEHTVKELISKESTEKSKEKVEKEKEIYISKFTLNSRKPIG